MLNGWIILDKPSGITSAHAVAKVKRILKPKKIGHAGTLDPLASGILPLALGEATKTVAYMMDAGKAYSFTVKWGEERDTDDLEGRVTQTSPERPSRAAVEGVLSAFTGVIQQTPPDYSAISISGQRAYAMARAGREVKLAAREVVVNSLEIAFYNAETTQFICYCGKGTYIRSLARDMGRKLGCMGHVIQLRRLKVGNFLEKDAISLEVLEEMGHKGAPGFLRPVASSLDDIPALDLTLDQAASLKRGQYVSLPQTITSSTVIARCDGNPVAIGEVRDGLLKPVRVFNL